VPVVNRIQSPRFVSSPGGKETGPDSTSFYQASMRCCGPINVALKAAVRTMSAAAQMVTVRQPAAGRARTRLVGRSAVALQ